MDKEDKEYVCVYIYIYTHTHTHTHIYDGILLSHENRMNVFFECSFPQVNECHPQEWGRLGA